MGKRAGRARPAPTGVMVEGAVYFQHPAHVNVENTCNFYLNTCNFYLIIIV